MPAAALMAVASVPACSLGPAYHRPSVDIPPAFAASERTAASSWPSQRWWEGFRSRELSALITLARAANQDLAAAAARVVQADAQVRINGSPLLPTVSGQGAYNYARNGIAGGSGYPWRFWLTDDSTVSEYRPGRQVVHGPAVEHGPALN